MLEAIPTIFDKAFLFEPKVHHDQRGLFKETWNLFKYPAGMPHTFDQDAVSISGQNVLRGMHYDLRMAKLVQVLSGGVFDVIVDIRKGSPTFGKWQGFYLTADNHQQLYVPEGFAHGFLSLTENTIFHYKMTVAYDPKHEGSIHWSDPEIGIDWPAKGKLIISEKDKQAHPLSEFRKKQEWIGHPGPHPFPH